MGKSNRSRQRRLREQERLNRRRARFIRGNIAGRVSRELELLDHVIDDAHDRVLVSTPGTNFENFQLRVYNRAFNIMKSIKLLSRGGHWEGAVGLARQLFEISLNMEYIFKQDDPEESAIEFVHFGLLQQMLRAQTLERYWRAQGFDIEPDDKLTDEALEDEFSAFRVGPLGKRRWARSWNGRSTRKMAEQSEMELRITQYDMLFAHWSEQVHGAPGAFMTGFIPISESSDEWASTVEALDERNTIEVLANSVNLFYEISLLLPFIHQSFDLAKMHPLLEEMNRFSAPSEAHTLIESRGEDRS